MTWLSAVPALRDLEPKSSRRLQALDPMDVPAGTMLFRAGEAVKGYVIVLDGRIGVHLIGPTGRDMLLYDVVPGKSCIQSTLGLLGGDDYTAEAVTVVFASFAERMQSMMHLLERVAFQKVEARLAAWLLSRAEAGTVHATQQDIASGIGSAREVVSRRLDALARQGAIAHGRGRVDILDAGLLHRLADDPAL